MFEFLNTFVSSINKGFQEAISKLIERSNSGDYYYSEQDLNTLLSTETSPATKIEYDVTTIPGYNQGLSSIYLDLNALYQESSNIWRALGTIENLSFSEIEKIRLNIQDLETKVKQSIKKANNKVAYTDNIVETFNAQTSKEVSPNYFQNNTIPEAFIDISDGLLKLPIDGDFNNRLSKDTNLPSNVFLDRIIGFPVSKDNLANQAFDGLTSSFWNETIHADAPIYASTVLHPWIPSTYKGGACCRLRIEFEKSTLISELDIRPYNSLNLLSISYTDESTNSILDPNFNFGLSLIPNAYWSINTTSFGVSGGAEGSILNKAGPNGENTVYLHTYNGTGAVTIQHGSVTTLPGLGIEVTVLLKTPNKIPVEFGATFIGSGGIKLSDQIETIYLESLGWTKVILTFDPPEGTLYSSIRIGIPPTFKRDSTLYICSPSIEHIKEFPLYEAIINRKTIYNQVSFYGKRVYLVFSQENYEFKHYSINEKNNTLSYNWERLNRRSYISEDILDYDKINNRASSINTFDLSITNESEINNHLRLGSENWVLLQQLESLAEDNSIKDFPVYEYNIGASEIYLRHREYGYRGRYVSTPIRINGEIKEIRLQAKDRYYKSPEEIKYTVTLNELDPPEKGKSIVNSNTFTQDISDYSPPPGNINYLDYTTWTYPNSYFQPIRWPENPIDDTPATREIVVVRMTPQAEAGLKIIRLLDSELDLRGTAVITFEHFLFASYIDGTKRDFKFKFGISSDGSSWLEQSFDGTFYNDYRFDTTRNVIFFPVTFNLTQFQPELKASIKYIKFELETPTLYTNNTYLMFRRIKAEGYFTGARTIKFISSEETDLATATSKDFICPVRKIKEDLKGTDRYSRLFLKYYPYINSEKIKNLITTMSLETSGRTVFYDPNKLNVKYLSNSVVTTIEGYRPILVTLFFPNKNIYAYPDILGIPRKNDIGYSDLEELSEASIDTIITSSSSETTSSSKERKKDEASSSSTRSSVIYQTLFKNLVSYKKGIPIICWWASGSTKKVIDNSKVKVDNTNGLVEIFEQIPPGYTKLLASYYYILGENSFRQGFDFGQIFVTTSSSSIVSQSYPVTRNVTDFNYKETPILRKVNLDILSPNYYPVYEYYIHSDGYLVFADDLFFFGDNPAEIEVEYDTLAITPRIIIDLYRPDKSSQTPVVDEYTLFINTKKV